MAANRTTRGAGLPPPAPRSSWFTQSFGVEGYGGSTPVSVTEIVSNLVFAGPLTWTDQAACRGQNELFFAPAGERPETRAVREDKARAVCSGVRRARAVPAVGPGEPRVRLLGW